jgi:surface antigen
MKTSLLFALAGTALSLSVYAADSSPKLLAGVEAGIDTDTSMTVSDLDKTQEILATDMTGVEESWYNIDTTTHYDVIVGEHFSFAQRPCVSYKLKVQHSSKTSVQDLSACMDYSGKWIAKLD